jgi:phosphoribosyl-dephospho-CoA transferase
VTSPIKADSPPARRHDLIFVSPNGWRSLLASSGGLVADPLVANWPDKEWPLIRRCAKPHEQQGVALGLPLPPSAGKRRLSFFVQSSDIVSMSRPPSLRSVRNAAPQAWWQTLDRLDGLAAKHSVSARVFGSLAWQTLTGLDYLSDRSDLDVLLDVNPDTDLDRLAAALAGIEAEAPVRLDGELVRDDGAAVNWREFHGRRGEILVKSIDRVVVLDRDLFIAGGMLP